MTVYKYLRSAGLALATAFSPCVAFASECQELFFDSNVGRFWQTATLEVVEDCLAEGMVLNESSRPGQFRTPFYLALRYSNNPAVIQALVHAGADVNAQIRDRQNSPSTNPWTPLWGLKNLEIVTLLIQAGADVNARTDSGVSHLSHVIEMFHFGDINEHGEIFETIRLLVASGANVNTQDIHGYTPLHRAVFLAFREDFDARPVIKFLIENSADMELKLFGEFNRGLQHTPLILCLSILSRCDEIAYLLLEMGADSIKSLQQGNISVAQLASCRNRGISYENFGYSNMLRVLLESGADPTIVSSAGQSAVRKAIKLNCISDIVLFVKYGFLDRRFLHI